MTTPRWISTCQDRRRQNSDIYWGIARGSIPREQSADAFNLRQFADEEITTQEALPPYAP